MNLKRIISSHFANYRESWEANRLIAKGKIHPTLSKSCPSTRSAGLRWTSTRTPTRAGRRALPGPRGGPRPRRGDARHPSTRSTASRGPGMRPAPVPPTRPNGRGSGWDRLPRSGRLGCEPISSEKGSAVTSDQGTVHLRRQQAGRGRDRPGSRRRHPGDACRPATAAGTPGHTRRPQHPSPPAGRAAGDAAGRRPDPSGAGRASLCRRLRWPPARRRGGFPVVRRGGYDKAAVDAQVRQLTSKSGLGTSLEQSERRVHELEKQLAAPCRSSCARNESPSYAGLGGRASALLRMAEEEAEEVRDTRAARRDRRDPRAGRRATPRQCGRGASRGPRTCAWCSSKRLDEHPQPAHGRRRAGAQPGRSEAADLVSSAQRGRPAALAAEQEANENSAPRPSAGRAGGPPPPTARCRGAPHPGRREGAACPEATDHHASATAETRRLVRRPRSARPPPRTGPALPAAATSNAPRPPPRPRALLSRARH